MKRSKKILWGVAATIFLGASIIAGNYYYTFKRENVSQEKIIYIYKHYTYDSLLNAIEKSGALDNFNSFVKAATKRELRNHFEPGRYRLIPGQSNQQIIRIIANCWQEPFQFTQRSHIRTMGKLASFLGSNFEADSAEFGQVLNNDSLRQSLGFTKETFIGMFIPNTYELYWTATPEDILKRMNNEYKRFWNKERCDKAKNIGLTIPQVMTLASIVNEETKNIEEMPTIASVYMNRLKKGMLLQADPTVVYANLDSEPNIRRVLKKHLKVDSPYNTYKHKGLPPGPITIPDIKAIEAVLNYEKSNYLYFCAKAELDGTHNFASTYSQHLKNARAYQKAISKR